MKHLTTFSPNTNWKPSTLEARTDKCPFGCVGVFYSCTTKRVDAALHGSIKRPFTTLADPKNTVIYRINRDGVSATKEFDGPCNTGDHQVNLGKIFHRAARFRAYECGNLGPSIAELRDRCP